MISRRSLSIDSSGIRRVFDLASKLDNPINLSIGQPDFDAPLVAREAAKEAIDSKGSGYTVTQGIDELRAGIKKKYQVENDLEVMITSGVSGGLMLSYFALLDPGDEILIPDPFFCIYPDLSLLVSAVATYYDTYPNFSLNIEKIEEAITEKTKAIIVNSPGNPTGYAISQAELNGVIELCRQKNIWLIYDEIYEKFCYDSPHAVALGKYEKTIILNGFSKSHGVPGWRLGFAIGPKNVISEMLKIQQYSFVCAPSVLQRGITKAIEFDFKELLQSYKERRDFICEALKDKFSFTKSSGAFYLFPEAPGGNGQAFVEKCIENNLLVVPGNVFSRLDTHFRISFSAPMEILEKGADVLNKLT